MNVLEFGTGNVGIIQATGKGTKGAPVAALVLYHCPESMQMDVDLPVGEIPHDVAVLSFPTKESFERFQRYVAKFGNKYFGE